MKQTPEIRADKFHSTLGIWAVQRSRHVFFDIRQPGIVEQDWNTDYLTTQDLFWDFYIAYLTQLNTQFVFYLSLPS
jgi:hypothetical protein